MVATGATVIHYLGVTPPLLLNQPAAPEDRQHRVRFGFKPGHKATKQLLAQYADRRICVRYRYDVHWKKLFTTVKLLVAKRDWAPPRPQFAHDQIVGLRVAFADWHTVTG